MIRGQFLEAVIWRNKDETCNGPNARQMDSDPTAQAAAHYNDVLVLGADLIEQSDSVGKEGCLRRLARASPVTPVVQQVNGVVRECSRKAGQIVRDILGIAAKVNQSIGPAVRAYRDEHFRPVDSQHDRGADQVRSRLRKVDERTLEYKQGKTQPQIGNRDNGGECEHGTRHGANC